ncbi:MAG: polymerase [Thermoleophilaceae bacterium]|jgi:DNA polymerase-4|nr:polymerase [Thermoleophilaceae bacterium]
MFVHAADILHADLDAFYASVEQRDDPRLRDRPVIVGPGVVLAASYEARAFGVRSAMGGARARRLCPEAVFVSPRWSAYVEASRAVFAVFERAAPVVEGLSIDEAFLDVSGLERISGTPTQIAVRLRREVRERVGLPITVGVASTKHLAKVASGVGKPDGLIVVPPERELEFLHPLPVSRLWGVGPATTEKLHALGIWTVGEIARMRETELMEALGRAAGRHLHAVAHNRDPRRVEGRRRRRSIGSQCALGRSPQTPETLDVVIVGLVDRVTRRMRASARTGRTVVLRLRFGDFSRATRSHTLGEATAASRAILTTARALMAAAMPTVERKGITLVGVSVTNLDRGAGGRQLELPLKPGTGLAVDLALDAIRDRFGPKAVTRAVLLDRGPGLSAWLLPEDDEPIPPGYRPP